MSNEPNTDKRQISLRIDLDVCKRVEKDMFLAAKEAKERGEDIGDWLNKLAKDHAAETKEDEAPADETKDAKPEAEPEG